MDVQIRPTTEDDYERFVRAVGRAFSEFSSQEELDAWRTTHEADRTLAAFDGGEMVGTAGAFSMTVAVPGGELPMAGVTTVGVAATHRRRGILTAMMRRQLD